MDMLIVLGLTVTISSWWWIIPTIPTLICLAFMFRPLQKTGGYFSGLDAVFRLVWLIPILFVWLVYFIIF